MEGTFDSQPGTACHMPGNVTPGTVGCGGSPATASTPVGPDGRAHEVARSPIPEERPLNVLERIIDKRLWR